MIPASELSEMPHSRTSDTAGKAKWGLHTTKPIAVCVCRCDAFSLWDLVYVAGAESSLLQPGSDPAAAAVASLAHDLLGAALPCWPPAYCSVNSICWAR